MMNCYQPRLTFHLPWTVIEFISVKKVSQKPAELCSNFMVSQSATPSYHERLHP